MKVLIEDCVNGDKISIELGQFATGKKEILFTPQKKLTQDFILFDLKELKEIIFNLETIYDAETFALQLRKENNGG